MLRILLVGSIGCGKTSFRQQLQDLPIQYSKTQAIEAMAGVIDTPGEYLEMGRYNHALMLASYDVDLVVLMHAATSKDTRYPPGFASMFNRRVLGVVTKIDLVPRFRVAQARERLTLAGAREILEVNSLTGEGFDAVRGVLADESQT